MPPCLSLTLRLVLAYNIAQNIESVFWSVLLILVHAIGLPALVDNNSAYKPYIFWQWF